MQTRSDGRPLELLLVEDSPGDVRLTQEAFRNADPAINLHVAKTALRQWPF
jgi:chemotaxis family two-component system response regulator Rcp1